MRCAGPLAKMEERLGLAVQCSDAVLLDIAQPAADVRKGVSAIELLCRAGRAAKWL